MKIKVFAQSRLDGLLILVALAQLAVVLCGVLTFGAVSPGLSLVLGLAAVFLMCTNFECVAHTFIHTPFFASRRLNAAFGVFNSLLIGSPQTLYRFHHLTHHKHNNDLPDPETGRTKDLSSIWRFGRSSGREESLWTYALLGYFRIDHVTLLRTARRKGAGRFVVFEVAALVVMFATLAWLNPIGFVAFYLPVWFLGTAGAQAQNYLEHYGSIPGDRRTDSVSSYGWLYNLIWFNHGYHQEHHFRPQVHWTRIRALRDLLPPESMRRVVRGAHWFNLRPPANRATPPGPLPS